MLEIPKIEETEYSVIIGVKYTANGKVVETQMDDGDLTTFVTLQVKDDVGLRATVCAGLYECAIHHSKARSLI